MYRTNVITLENKKRTINIQQTQIMCCCPCNKNEMILGVGE